MLYYRQEGDFMEKTIFNTIVSVFNIGGKILSSKDLYNSQLVIVRPDGSQSESSVAGHDWKNTIHGEVLTIFFYTGKIVRWNPRLNHWEELIVIKQNLHDNESWNPVSFYILITDFDDDNATENERLLSFILPD